MNKPSELLLLVTIIFVSLSPLDASAQFPERLSDEARFSLLTAFPGSSIYSMWGHSALRIWDPANNVDLLINYGALLQSDPLFLAQFIYGKTQSFLSVRDDSAFLFAAALEKRRVVEQVLRLSAEEQHAILDQLRIDNLPENQAYDYDFLRNNCSTRILGLLLEFGDIQLNRDALTSSYREALTPYLISHPGIRLFKDFAFGPSTDVEIDRPGQGFLPVSLGVLLDGASASDGTPLVIMKRTILDYEVREPQPYFPWTFVLFGTFAAIILAYTLWRIRKGLEGVTLFDRLLLGFVGAFGLFGAWGLFFTLHWVQLGNVGIFWNLPTHAIAAFVVGSGKVSQWYLRVSAVLIVVVVTLQLTGVLHPVPLPLVPFLAAFAIRLWIIGGPSTAS